MNFLEGGPQGLIVLVNPIVLSLFASKSEDFIKVFAALKQTGYIGNPTRFVFPSIRLSLEPLDLSLDF